MKILTVVGARPQFIKAAPVLAALKRHGSAGHVLVHTGQHALSSYGDGHAARKIVERLNEL